MDWAAIEGEVVLVGNGPISGDCHDLADRADLVFRFNYPSEQGVRATGSRTDVLAVNNVGKPALQLISRGVANVAENAHVLFARSAELHREYYERCGFERYPLSMVGAEAAIVRQHDLRCYSVIGKEDVAATFAGLWDSGASGFAMPSIGFQVFDCLIRRSRGRPVLVGFTFEGWEGHPWAAERKIVEAHVAAGRAEWLR